LATDEVIDRAFEVFAISLFEMVEEMRFFAARTLIELIPSKEMIASVRSVGIPLRWKISLINAAEMPSSIVL
jgi:hypothetical protein